MIQRAVNDVWAGASAGTPSLFHILGRVWETLTVYQQRASERAALRSVDDHGLWDLGLTRADVWQECRKPFWRA